MLCLTGEDTRKLLLKLRLAIGNVVTGGEFAEWVVDKEMPFAAMMELQQLEELHAALLELEAKEDRQILKDLTKHLAY